MMDGLRGAFESIGGLIRYQLSLLPKWVRAMFWAWALAAFLIFIVVSLMLAVIWIVQTFGGEAFVIAIFIGAIFVICLATVWDYIPEAKRKNGE